MESKQNIDIKRGDDGFFIEVKEGEKSFTISFEDEFEFKQYNVDYKEDEYTLEEIEESAKKAVYNFIEEIIKE